MIKAVFSSFLFFISLHATAQDLRILNGFGISEDSTFIVPGRANLTQTLTRRIDSVQQYVAMHIDDMELMAIVEQGKAPVKVEEEKWPAELEVSLNILRDEAGRVIYYAQYPMSRSGDWLIAYQYFIDGQSGKVYGFRRMAHFFNSHCVSEVAFETATWLFDEQFNIIAKSYSLTDEEGVDLANKECEFPYDFKYRIASRINKLPK